MKKRLSVLALLLCAALLMGACAKEETEAPTTEPTLPQVDVELKESDRVTVPDFGISVIIPENFYSSGGDASLEDQYSKAGYLAMRLGYVDQIAVYDYYQTYYDAYHNTDSTDEELEKAYNEYIQAFYSNSWDLAVITRMPKADYQAAVAEEKDLAELTGMAGEVEVYHETEDSVYLICRPPYDPKSMTADNAQQIQVVEAFIEPILSTIRYTGVGVEDDTETVQAGELPAFTTTDLAGNTVTQAVFAEKDLTVVNVWGTFCGPCISEMPDLGQWAKEMPENVQLVGIVCDVEQGDSSGIATAQEILEKTGCDFVNLTVSGDLTPFLDGIAAVPTTFLVDSQGNIVGDYIVGARMGAYKEAVEAYLSGE